MHTVVGKRSEVLEVSFHRTVLDRERVFAHCEGVLRSDWSGGRHRDQQPLNRQWSGQSQHLQQKKTEFIKGYTNLASDFSTSDTFKA